MRGLKIGLGVVQGGGLSAAVSVSIGAGPFTTGTLLTATVNGLEGGETVTYQWQDDGVNITGATSSTYVAAIGTDGIADASLIRCVVTVNGGDPINSNAREIRYAAGTAPAVADGQSWTVDDTSVNIDGSASGANLTFSYALSGAPAGLSINPTTGSITGTPTFAGYQSASSGTATITATDQYGRELTDTFTWTTALRAQATAADGLGPFGYVIDDSDTISINFVADFTANGNTLTYSIAGLPTGGVDDGDGTASGTATTQGESGSIVCTATDEYGRQTTSTASFTVALRTQATGGADLDLAYPEGSAITPQNLLANWTANGNTLTFVSVSPTLPAGLSINSSGVLSGTPTTPTADATYTLTMEDEYGRQTSDTFTLEITEAGVDAPVNSVAPVVSGDTSLGDVLSTTNGTWTGTGISYSYQWQRNGVNISGATGATYTIVAADSAAAVRCVVTATKAGGGGQRQLKRGHG